MLPCARTSSTAAQQFGTLAFDTMDTSRPGHTVGSRVAAGSVKRACRFPFANRNGVGKATECWVRCARVGSPLPCWIPCSSNQGSRSPQ